MGIISEAGCPGIADPGAELVALAHKHELSGNSFSRSLFYFTGVGIASGANGQNFSFNGYLPISKPERIKTLKAYEKQSAAENRTQLFIETPYRNVQLFEDMIATLSPMTRLTIACDITTENEYIKTMVIKDWKHVKPDINKRPTIFRIIRPTVLIR